MPNMPLIGWPAVVTVCLATSSLILAATTQSRDRRHLRPGWSLVNGLLAFAILQVAFVLLLRGMPGPSVTLDQSRALLGPALARIIHE